MNRIHVPTSFPRGTLDWYHSYLNLPGGNRLAKTLEKVSYWKGLTNQAKQYASIVSVVKSSKA